MILDFQKVYILQFCHDPIFTCLGQLVVIVGSTIVSSGVFLVMTIVFAVVLLCMKWTTLKQAIRDCFGNF